MQGTNASDPKTFHRLPGGFQKQVCHNPSLEAWIGRFFPQPTTIDIPFVAANTSDRTATLWSAAAFAGRPTPCGRIPPRISSA